MKSLHWEDNLFMLGMALIFFSAGQGLPSSGSNLGKIFTVGILLVIACYVVKQQKVFLSSLGDIRGILERVKDNNF